MLSLSLNIILTLSKRTSLNIILFVKKGQRGLGMSARKQYFACSLELSSFKAWTWKKFVDRAVGFILVYGRNVSGIQTLNTSIKPGVHHGMRVYIGVRTGKLLKNIAYN